MNECGIWDCSGLSVQIRAALLDSFIVTYQEEISRYVQCLWILLHCLIFSVNPFSVWSEKLVVASLRNSQLLGVTLGHKTWRDPCTHTFAYPCSVVMTISLIKLRVRLIQRYSQRKLLLNSIISHCHSKVLDAQGSLTDTNWSNGFMYCIIYLFHPPFSTFLAVYSDKGIILIKTELGAELIPAGYYTVCDTKQQINKLFAHHVCNYCAQLYSVGELALTSPCLFSAASWLPLLHCRIWKSFLRWVTHFRGLWWTSLQLKDLSPSWLQGESWAMRWSKPPASWEDSLAWPAVDRRTVALVHLWTPYQCSGCLLGVQVHLQRLLV